MKNNVIRLLCLMICLISVVWGQENVTPLQFSAKQVAPHKITLSKKALVSKHPMKKRLAQKSNKSFRSQISDLLWDNTNISVDNNGIISTELGGLASGSTLVQAADDFVVPGGETWNIDSVYAEGFISGNDTTLTPLFPNSFIVAFYNNSGNTPGSLISENPIPASSFNSTSFRLEAALSTPTLLTQGTYWVSIYAVYDNATNFDRTRWNWFTGPTSIGLEAHLQDLTGLFGGFSWMSLSTLDATFDPSFTFALFGSDAPLLNPPAPISPGNGNTGVAANVTFNWNAVSGAGSYGIEVATSGSFTEDNIVYQASDLGTSTTVALAENTTYYWRVNAATGGAVSDWSATQNFSTVTEINLNRTFSFTSRGDNPADYNSSDYQLIGIPGQTDVSVSSFLSGTQGTDWQVYRDNGSASATQTGYAERYNGSANFNLGSGRAFWVISKNSVTVNQAVTAVSLSSFGEFNIPVRTNGNLITNPFPVPVTWQAVTSANNLPPSTMLYELRGGNLQAISSETQMMPYTGYFYSNDAGASTLQIPYPHNNNTSAITKVDPALWRIGVELTSGEFYNRTASFGVAPDSESGRDELDFRKPRGFGSPLAVAFHHPEWDETSAMFATDIRPEFSELETWEISVDAIANEPAELTFTGVADVPEAYGVYLLPISGVEKIDLRQNNSYHFTPRSSRSKFVVAVGYPSVVESQLTLLAPKDFALGQNYPNPFNPTTSIPVAIAQQSDVELTVYNVLGQEVANLFTGTLQPGRYWFDWNARDISGRPVVSGIYIYRLTVPQAGVVRSGKMILLK